MDYDWRRANMVAMWVRADVEIEIVLGHANLSHICNDLVLMAITNSSAFTKGITRIRAVGIIIIFSRIDHAKMTVALDDNRIAIIEWKYVNAHLTR